MIIELILSVAATAGVYEYLHTIVKEVPYWLILPVLVGISAGVYFLPLMWLIIVAVASATGFLHGAMSRKTQQVVINPRRSGLPRLP
jgi:hypothetical protein